MSHPSTDGESPSAFPEHRLRKDTWGGFEIKSSPGLTKREYIAAFALRSIAGMALDHGNEPNISYYQRAAACAVVAADSLIAELEKPRG